MWYIHEPKPYQYLCLIYSPVGSRYKGVQNMQATLQRAVDYQRLCVVQTAGRVTLTVLFQRLFVVQVFAYICFF